MEDDNAVPEGLINFIRKRSSRNEQTRFPYKLYSLLVWVGTEPQKSKNAGCGWISDTEFFIDKKKICELMNIKLNTLNVNLKTLGFEKSQSNKDNRVFFKNEGFSRSGTMTVGFESIRNSRCKSESLRNLNLSAVYMPYLEPLKLFMMTEQEINQFKHDVIEKWNEIVELHLVFAIPLNLFIKFLKSIFDDKFCDLSSAQQALTPRVPEVWDILDFAIFLSRFGPFCNIQSKLNQYQDLIDDIQLGFITYSTPSSNYFSDTFHNCFRFHLPQIGEYHCYNLPLVQDNTPFLADEDGVVYPSWRKMLQQNQFLSQGNYAP